MKKRDLKFALRISLLYAVFGVLWVFFSDLLLLGKVTDPYQITLFQTYKGWAFVSVSALLLFFGIWHELKIRKQAEAALLESEEKFRRLAEESLVGIYIIQDGVFKYANPKLAEIFGYEAEELIERKGPKDLTFPEDWPIVEENLKKRISGEIESVHYSFRGIKKNKEAIYIEVYGSRIAYRGRPAVIGSLIDITERRQTEENLNLLLDTIKKAKLDWEMTFDNVIEFIALVDKEFNIIRCNKSLARFIGKPITSITGCKFYDVFPWGHEETEYFRDKIQKEEPTEWIETRIKTGEWFYLNHRPAVDKNGVFLHSVIIATDITGLKNAQEMIVESHEELKKKVEELEKFYEMAVDRELKMRELKREMMRLNDELEGYKKEVEKIKSPGPAL